MVAAFKSVEARRSTELGYESDEGVFQQASVFEVCYERREGLICAAHHDPMSDAVTALTTGSVSNRAARAFIIDIVVVVPVHVETAGRFVRQRFSDIDRHESNAAFDQSSPHQITLPAVASAVRIASGILFFRQVEGALRQRVCQQVGGLIGKIGKGADRAVRSGSDSDVEIAEQVSTIVEASSVDAGQQAEVADLPFGIGKVTAAGFENLG